MSLVSVLLCLQAFESRTLALGEDESDGERSADEDDLADDFLDVEVPKPPYVDGSSSSSDSESDSESSSDED